MDYNAFIDSFQGIACVVSLRKDAVDGNHVAITAANKKYLASVGKADEDFVPNRPYTYYISKDPNFEALTTSCINNRKISHQYVNAALYNAWIDLYMIPLEDDEDGNGYCVFSYEMTPSSDSDKMIEISERTAYMVLKTCIKFRENDDFKATMDSIVKDIRSQCESDGCAIILADSDKEIIDLLSFDHIGGFAPAEDDVFFRPEFYHIVCKWQEIMAGSNCFIISNEKELKAVEQKDPEWYKTLVFSGIKSLVLYPLRVKDNLYGYIFASNFNSDKITFIREVMELNSFILSGEVENYRMHQKLEELSRMDILLGVFNSNAMNQRITELMEGSCEIEKGLGVVFIDVNGLKRVNDTLGHNEGDEMLKKVSAKLKSVFTGKEIYRAGGDEFLIITTDMDKDEFYSTFERLKAVSRVAGEPAFALGAHFDEKDHDIKEIMHIADSNMYKNKAEYYENNPAADRRSRPSD
ncbi:MAG: GGDEF domain-containing protein [Lachnospiraceae bacterium]|nr:GGDEF domain-containing protein [Lachnospiraceae bacterium]